MILKNFDWEKFSEKWERILSATKLFDNKKGVFYFKMSEMTRSNELMEKLPGFYRIIEEHIFGMVSIKINISELRNAILRLSIPNTVIDWARYENS